MDILGRVWASPVGADRLNTAATAPMMATPTRHRSSWHPGSCSVTFTHSSEPLLLPTNTGPGRPFSDLCKDITPSCNLNPFLFNGHLQTAWTAMKWGGPHVHYKRRVFCHDNPTFDGHFAVDFVVKPPPPSNKPAMDGGADDQGLREDPSGVGHTRLPPRTTYFSDKEFKDLGSDDCKPLLITLHGLAGGSFEDYLRHVLAPLVAQAGVGESCGLSGGEWEALVINSRGCSGSKITSNVVFNGRATWDMRQTVKWAREIWPNRPIFGIGYSLGANIITNYVAEEGSDCLLAACIAVSNPFNLETCGRALQRTYIGSELYSKGMGTSMKKLYNRHSYVLKDDQTLDDESIQHAEHLHEFDREVQCAIYGYPTEDAYYRDISSSDSLIGIRIPYLAIHAQDDPIAVDEAMPYREFMQNPYTVLLTTSSGGHLGWFEYGGGRWHVKPITAWLNTMMEDIDWNRLKSEPCTNYCPSADRRPRLSFDPVRKKAFVA